MIDYDLRFVAPHRRDEVLRRIRVLDRFVANPGRAAAEKCAAELQLGVAQFYRLAGIWRAGRKPEQLTATSRARPRRSLASKEQRDVVDAAIAELPDALLNQVTSRAIELGRTAGVAMPSPNSIRKLVELSRSGRLSQSSPALGADVVVTTCAIDMAVTTIREPSPTMPVATFVIDTRTPPAILGVALSPDDGDVDAVARALIDAAMTWKATPSAPEPVLAIEEHTNVANSDLMGALTDAGVQVAWIQKRPRPVMSDAVALLGRKPAGYRLLPGLTAGGRGRSRPTRPAGACAMELNEAEDVLRSRLVRPPEGHGRNGLTSQRADELVRRLKGFGAQPDG